MNATFLDRLSETSVTFVSDLSVYWTDKTGPGYEAVAITGEVQAFDTYKEANQFRLNSLAG